MNTDGALADAICDSLARLGSSVQGVVGPVQSYVETHHSQVLDLVALLVFHPPGDRSYELAVVSVEARGVRWTIDLVDRESMVVWEEHLVSGNRSEDGGEGTHPAVHDVDRLLAQHRAATIETVRKGLG